MTPCTFTVHGARGGHPVAGPAVARHGPHTTCYSLETPDGLLVFDAGTGIERLSAPCLAAGPRRPIAGFFSHFHLDHVIGLGAFAPLYRAGFRVDLHGFSPSPAHPWPGLLQDLFDEPYWPVPLRRPACTVAYHDLDRTPAPLSVHGVEVAWCELAHTQRCLGYRVNAPGGSVVILTDHEPARAEAGRVEAFAAGADVLVMDAQYRPEEYDARRGWGHGTWADATAFARAAGAGRLLLCHHDPARTDDELDAIRDAARASFPRTDVAREGLSLPL